MTNLTSNSSRTWKQNYRCWRIRWCGASRRSTAPIWYTADPNSRADTGADDDTWTFTLGDKSFRHRDTNGGTAVKFEYAADLPVVLMSL